jgi:alanyl aminopeptidase
MIRSASAVALALTLMAAGCSKNTGVVPGAGAAEETSSAVPLAMLPRTIIPSRYRIALTIDPAKSGFSGHTEIAVTVAQAQRAYFIHGLDLTVSRVVARLASGATIPATYKQVHDSGVATLEFAKSIPAGRATLVFDYDAPFNTSLSGLYKVVSRGDSYAFTQFESSDARRVFPSFDEPGFKTPFDVTVTAPSADKVVGNTDATSAAAGNGTTKWTFATTKPLPTYLLALAVGPLDIVDGGNVPPNQYRSYPLHLRGVTARGMGQKLKYALSLTPAVVTALENYYGVAYPFPKLDTLAVPDFAAGAMENAGAITYREQLLLMDANAPLEQRRSSLTVQAHEIAHQWFGDLVTPRWWDDIWLNESFATWMEYKIAQAVRPEWDYSEETLKSSLGVMRLDELPSARHIHNPVRSPDDISNAFDDITYSKGGAVLSMFESFVGPEAFEKGIHAYLTKFAFKNATAQDFIGTIAHATGHPEIVAAFNDFIDQPHIPLIETDAGCENGATVAHLRQRMYLPVGLKMETYRWRVPMCLASGGARACQIMGTPRLNVTVSQKCGVPVFPNDNGAGYYRFNFPQTQWQALIGKAAALSPADRLTLFHNIDAALRAGELSAADFYGTMAALAPLADWNLLSSDHRDSFNLTDALHDMRVTGLLTPAGAIAQAAYVRKLYGPRLQQLALTARAGEPVTDSLMRQYLAQVLVEEGRDADVIAALAKSGQTYIASGERDSGALPPELLQEAMRAAVMSGGAAFGNALIDAVQKSDDEYFMQSAIYALAGSPDQAVLNRLLGLALTPTIRTGDLRYVLRYFSAEPAAKAALWAWFKINFGNLEKRVSKYGMAYTPEIQKFGCSPEERAELRNVFAMEAGSLVGLPRTLRENLDRIDRCLAFKAAKGAEINTTLATLH